MSASLLYGPWWPNWVELADAPVGLTLRGRFWRLVDLSALAAGGVATVFGSKFEQRHYAAECAVEEWELEQQRRIEAALPLGARPGFMAFHNGDPVAGGRFEFEAKRRARSCLPLNRAARKRIAVAAASQAAMEAWVTRGAAAPIVRKRLSHHRLDHVVLTFDEAEEYAAGFADRVGFVTHSWIEILPFGATEDEAWARGVAAMREMYSDDQGGLEICEATAAGRDLIQAGVNLCWKEVEDLSSWEQPEFIDGDVHLARIPGQEVTSVVCCSSAEARALYEIEKLLPAEADLSIPIRVTLC